MPRDRPPTVAASPGAPIGAGVATTYPPPDFVAPAGPFPGCAEQCALLAEANHRAANQFNELTSYIHLSLREFRRRPGEVEDLQMVLVAVEAKARALAHLNRMLTARPTSNEPVDLAPILHKICATFAVQVGRSHKIVDEVSGRWLVTPLVSLAVGQIVTEAVMNAVKYAYPGQRGGEIVIRTSVDAPPRLVVEIIDHGAAAAPPVDHDGFGTRLMRGLALKENIALTFTTTSPGLSVRLGVPAAASPMGTPTEVLPGVETAA